MGIYVNPNNDGLKQSINSKIYVDKSGMFEIFYAFALYGCFKKLDN